MKLHTVTITGADDSTDIQQLVDLSAEFPFVEWGILVSKKEEGNSRFPTREWIDRFGKSADDHNLKVGMHLCGRWSRDFCVGKLDFVELPSVANFAQRIQINTWGYNYADSRPVMFDWPLAGDRSSKCFIFQWTLVGEMLTNNALDKGYLVSGLFDGSGGHGLLPSLGWPSSRYFPFPMGYAGGLGPENISEQLRQIMYYSKASTFDAWIDMEKRVRTEDDSQLDISRVRRVLEHIAGTEYLNQTTLPTR